MAAGPVAGPVGEEELSSTHVNELCELWSGDDDVVRTTCDLFSQTANFQTSGSLGVPTAASTSMDAISMGWARGSDPKSLLHRRCIGMLQTCNKIEACVSCNGDALDWSATARTPKWLHRQLKKLASLIPFSAGGPRKWLFSEAYLKKMLQLDHSIQAPKESHIPLLLYYGSCYTRCLSDVGVAAASLMPLLTAMHHFCCRTLKSWDLPVCEDATPACNICGMRSRARAACDPPRSPRPSTNDSPPQNIMAASEVVKCMFPSSNGLFASQEEVICLLRSHAAARARTRPHAPARDRTRPHVPARPRTS